MRERVKKIDVLGWNKLNRTEGGGGGAQNREEMQGRRRW